MAHHSRHGAPRHHRWRAGGAVVACGLVLGASAFVAPTASSASRRPAAKLSPLEEGMRFYRGKTITLIVPTNAGQTYDIAERITAPYLAKFLRATVNIENIAGGQTLTGQDVTAHSNPDGLTIGLLTPSTDAFDNETGVSGLNFNPEREAFLAGNDPQEQLLITQPNSGLTTFSDLLHDVTAAHPLTNITITGGAEFITALLMKAFGIPVSFLTGYASAGVEVSGWVRGDGESWLTNLATAGTLIPNKAVPVALEAPDPRGTEYTAELTKVPTVAQLLKRYPPKTSAERQAAAALTAMISLQGFLYYAPSATPVPEVAALQAAFHYAFTNPNWRQQSTLQGLGTGYVSGASMKAVYSSALAIIPKALKTLGGTV